METHLIDSSSDPIYKEKAKQKSRARAILKKHLKPLGIGFPSKFSEAALSAMQEYLNTETILKQEINNL